jgi:hypothetical protein
MRTMFRQPLQKKPNGIVLAAVGFNPTMHGTHHSARTRSTNIVYGIPSSTQVTPSPVKPLLQ